MFLNIVAVSMVQILHNNNAQLLNPFSPLFSFLISISPTIFPHLIISPTICILFFFFLLPALALFSLPSTFSQFHNKNSRSFLSTIHILHVIRNVTTFQSIDLLLFDHFTTHPIPSQYLSFFLGLERYVETIHFGFDRLVDIHIFLYQQVMEIHGVSTDCINCKTVDIFFGYINVPILFKGLFLRSSGLIISVSLSMIFHCNKDSN